MKALLEEVERLRQENRELRQENRELQELVRQLKEYVTAAGQQVQQLTQQLGQDSHNSHWPPSRDKSRKTSRTKSLRKKSDKSPGGQKGHVGQTLELQEKPDVIVAHRPEACSHCQQPFPESARPVAIDRRQVHDLPPMQLVVTEHQAETLACPNCQQCSQGTFPANVVAPAQYGPRIQQLAVYLKNEQYLPYDRSRQLLADLFGLELSPGTLQNMIERAATRLRPVVDKIREALTAGNILNCDETGFYIGGKRHWLHVAGNERLTCYFPHRSRGSKATQEMGILPGFRGRAVHDSLAAYYQYQECEHGLCNVHHLRELTAVAENDGQGWADRFKALLLSAKQGVARARLAGETALPPQKVAQVERLYDRLTAAGLQANPPPDGGWPQAQRGRPKKTKARNLAERFEKRRPEVLAFVYDFRVPFDNNLAERDIRMLKVQQKISGCFRSQSGAEDFCTIRSYLSTLRKQGIRVWSALESLFSGDIIIPDLTPV
jgi:transposase